MLLQKRCAEQRSAPPTCYFLLNFVRLTPNRHPRGDSTLILLFSFEFCYTVAKSVAMSSMFSLAIFFWILYTILRQTGVRAKRDRLAIFFWILCANGQKREDAACKRANLLFSFEFCRGCRLCWDNMQAPQDLLFSFEFCERVYQVEHAYANTACYFLLNFVQSSRWPSHTVTCPVGLAIFFWILLAASVVHP